MKHDNTLPCLLLAAMTVYGSTQILAASQILISSPVGSFSGKISSFDSESGQSLGTFATTASTPQGLAFGPDGFLYVATYDSITRVSPSGVSSIFLSEGLTSPVGLAFDSNGDLFVSNAGNNSILKVSPDGVPTLFAYGAGIFSPRDLTFGMDGFLYVGNSFTESISRISQSGEITTFATGGGLSGPDGLAFDNLGNLYVVNKANYSISKVSPTGDVSLFASGTHFSQPVDVAYDNGHLYVTSYGSSRIIRLSLAGDAEEFAGIYQPLYLTTNVVPEPSTLLFCVIGATAFACCRMFRRSCLIEKKG